MDFMVMSDGHVVTKSCRWISSRYYVFLLHKEHTNAESVPPRIICSN